MLRASQKKTLYDGLKAQISYEILNVAVASESISSGLMKSKDQLIEKHMKRIEHSSRRKQQKHIRTLSKL